MLIIIEGVDCSGKSTLAKRLMNQMDGLTTFLSKGPPTHTNPVVEYVLPLATYMPNKNLNIVCDRWHLGEMVYPRVFNRNSIMSWRQFRYIDDVIRELGGIVVYLEPDHNIILRRFNERGDSVIRDEKTLLSSYTRFSAVFDVVKTDDIYSTNYVKLKEDIDTGKTISEIMQMARLAEKAAGTHVNACH